MRTAILQPIWAVVAILLLVAPASWPSGVPRATAACDHRYIILLSGWDTASEHVAGTFQEVKEKAIAPLGIDPSRVREFSYNYPFPFNDFHTYEALPRSGRDALRSQIADILRDCSDASIDLIGHSLGGVVAWELMSDTSTNEARHVRRLITADSPIKGVPYERLQWAAEKLSLPSIVTGTSAETLAGWQKDRESVVGRLQAVDDALSAMYANGTLVSNLAATSDLFVWREFAFAHGAWEKDLGLKGSLLPDPARCLGSLGHTKSPGHCVGHNQVLTDPSAIRIINQRLIDMPVHPPPLRTDLNGDHVVNAPDIRIMLDNWSPPDVCGHIADINGDCRINTIDYSAIVSTWGRRQFEPRSASTSGTVPTLALAPPHKQGGWDNLILPRIALAGSVPARSPASVAGPGRMVLLYPGSVAGSPPITTPRVSRRGDTFGVQVDVSSAGMATTGSDATLTYDSSRLRVLNVVASGPYANNLSYTATDGLLTMSGVTQHGSPVAAFGTLATVTFEVLPTAPYGASAVRVLNTGLDPARTDGATIVDHASGANVIGTAGDFPYQVQSANNVTAILSTDPFTISGGLRFRFEAVVGLGAPAGEGARGVGLRGELDIAAPGATITTSQGSCERSDGPSSLVIGCHFGDLGHGQTGRVFVDIPTGMPMRTVNGSMVMYSTDGDSVPEDDARRTTGSPRVTDLVATVVPDAPFAPIGSDLGYAVTAANRGNVDNELTSLTIELPTGSSVTSVVASRGTCQPHSTTLICSIGTLTSNDAVTVRLVVRHAVRGEATTTANVWPARAFDPGNDAIARTTVSVGQNFTCTPRPAVDVNVQRTGDGRLLVRVRAGAGFVERIQFGTSARPLANALVQLPTDLQPVPGPRVVTPAPNTTELSFILAPIQRGAAATVPLVVTDGCGAWETLVGGGPLAF